MRSQSKDHTKSNESIRRLVKAKESIYFNITAVDAGEASLQRKIKKLEEVNKKLREKRSDREQFAG